MKGVILLAACAALLACAAPARAATPFTYGDNPVTGKVVASNDKLKLVWGYKPLPSEGNNRGGGSLYGLWDKTRDPDCARNLIQSLPKSSDPMSGYMTPSRAGIGGFGATKAYVGYRPDAISEIGLRGTMLNRNVRIDATGNLRVDFTFVVYGPVSGSDGPKLRPTYQVTKQWTATRSGLIDLHISWLWLYSEPAIPPNYNFAVSRTRGWERVGWYSHHWTDCLGVGSDGWSNPNQWTYDRTLATEGDCDYPIYHAQKVTFDKSPSAPPLTIAIGAGRGGYEWSELFEFGFRAWSGILPPYGQITAQFSNYRTAAYGHEVRWSAWYSDDGGRLTPWYMPSRFYWLHPGDHCDDYFTIKLGY